MTKQYRRMPVNFGPMPGPRQTFYGQPRKNSISIALTATITFRSTQEILTQFLPNSSYSFQKPGPDAYASFVSQRLDNLDWLAGRGYDLLLWYIHGVQYTSPDGRIYRASYIPVVFENMADPIISGREELGWPKLFSELHVSRDTDGYQAQLSWEGSVFGNFVLEDLSEVDDLALWTPPEEAGVHDGLLTHRYVPKVGYPGLADVDYQSFLSAEKENARSKVTVKRRYIAKRASFSFHSLNWQRLPTLHHIVARLAEIPNLEVVGGSLVVTNDSQGLSSTVGV